MTDSKRATMSETAETMLCIICSEAASDKIVKDGNFSMLLDLYWNAIRVDVKPDMNKGFNLCVDCFEKLNQFYHVNDVLVYFEARLGQLQREILKTNMNGIMNRQEKGIPLNGVHRQIIEEFGTNLPPAVDAERKKATLKQYHVTISYEEEKESTSSQNETSKKSPAKRPQPQQKGQKKRKLRRGRSHQSGSDDESDGSNYSDDTILSPGQEATGERAERSSKRSTVSSKANEKETSPAKGGGTVTGERECKICLDKFESFSAFEKHRRQHRVGDNEDKYECRHCLQQFNRQTKLIDHKKNCSEITKPSE